MAFFFDFFGDLVFHFRRRGIFFLGIREHAQSVKADFFHKRQVFFVILFRFPGESGNQRGA